MRCPQCGGDDLSVTDTRQNAGTVDRVRVCSCGCKLRTVEYIVEAVLPLPPVDLPPAADFAKRKKRHVNPRRLSQQELFAKQRGFWVPEDKKDDWAVLKKSGYSSAEAGEMLKLEPYVPTVAARRTRRAPPATAGATSATH